MSQTSLPSSAIKPQVAARFTYVEPDKVLPRLTCPVCLEPFIEPRRTPCKHTFCQSCITFIAAQPNAACPTCRAPLSNAKLETADETLLEFLGELLVYCTNKGRQCNWKGPRANLKEHLERTCDRVACRYDSRACSFQGKARVVQKHELECAYGDAPCVLKCGYVGQRRFHSEHQGNCPIHIKQQEEARKKGEEEARKRREQAEAEEKRDRELQQLYDSLNPAAENVLHLNVGGQHFQTSRGVLCREPQSVLAGLFTAKRPLQRDNAGVVFLDLDPVAFRHVLAWLRTGVVPRSLELDQKAVVLDTAERLKLWALIAMLRVEPEKNHPLTQVELLHLVKKNCCHSVQLPGVNLSGLCLYGLDLTKANLANANLVNANLTNAILANVDLTNANLTNANLNNANLDNANLTNANLTNVNLTNAVGKAIVRGVNLTGANLCGRDFRGVDLTNANLTKTKLSNANLASANLANADLTQANLTDAQLPYANLGNANLANANLSNANILNAVLTGSNLSGVDLSGRDFGRRDLSNANLINANLTNANLANAHLTNTNLTNANLLNADLTSASLYHANLTGANLNNANLTGANLTNANLTNTSLTNANLTGANLTNASIDKACGSYRLHA